MINFENDLAKRNITKNINSNKLRLFIVSREDADWEEDDKIIVQCKNFKECINFAIEHNWNIYTENNSIKFKELLKKFDEENLGLGYFDGIKIDEVTNIQGILLESNKGS